jgi:hypothetical protein
MTAKPTGSSTPFPKLGKEQTESMLDLQKELLEACEQASRAWLARVKSEVDLWSELAAKLARTQSAPEAWELIRNASHSGCKWPRKIGSDSPTTIKRSCKRSRGHRPTDGRSQALEIEATARMDATS